MILERADTKNSHNDALAAHIAESVGIPLQQIIVATKTSTEWNDGLQVADYVAWGLFQKHERSNDSFATIVHPCIICEDIIGMDITGSVRLVSDFVRAK